MQNFSEYLDLNPTLINQCFNTVTREGQDQIFFEDVMQIIGYLEEAKFASPGDEATKDKEELRLSPIEMKLLLDNFEELSLAKGIDAFLSRLNDVMLMFVVEWESRFGRGSAPDVFGGGQQSVVFREISSNGANLRKELVRKLKEKGSGEIWELGDVQSVVIFEREAENESSTAEKRGKSTTKGSKMSLIKGRKFSHNISYFAKFCFIFFF